MTVRAKMIVKSLTSNRANGMDEVGVNLEVVHEHTTENCEQTCEENKKFGTHTPSGNIYLGIVNREAADQFEVGKAYYVDFTPAE